MLTLVTGSNSRYFNFLKQVLNNITNLIEKNNYKNINIVVYDLGITLNELNELKLFTNIVIEKFDFNKYPEHVSLEKYNGNNCSYAWKPTIIYEVCEKYGGLVHWMDTRNLYSNFNNLIDVLTNVYIYSPASSGNIEKWTHEKTLKYMDGYKYQEKICRGAGIFGINYDIDWCKDFVKEWKDLALIKECICPEGSDRSNHRQDQAVLNILYYKYCEKYNFKIIDHYIDLSVHNTLKS
jgi:hypothetical protein